MTISGAVTTGTDLQPGSSNVCQNKGLANDYVTQRFSTNIVTAPSKSSVTLNQLTSIAMPRECHMLVARNDHAEENNQNFRELERADRFHRGTEPYDINCRTTPEVD